MLSVSDSKSTRYVPDSTVRLVYLSSRKDQVLRYDLSMQRLAFLAALGAGLAAAKPLSKVRVGFIGTGSRGTTMLEWTLRQPAVEVNAVCDTSEERATHAQTLVEKATGRRPIPYTRGPEDYKRMLDRSDL